jgi:hypothetical protein
MITSGALPHAPTAGAQHCPRGTVPHIEHVDAQGTLRSCIVQGRDDRNTPYRHGPYELVRADGLLVMVGQWRNNKNHGRWRWWHPNKTLRREMIYRDGAPLADASWSDAGLPIDHRDGSGSTQWYANGNKQSERRTERDGALVTSTWTETGTLVQQARTVNGARDGLQTEWFDTGAKREQARWRAGALVDWKGWSSTGRELVDTVCDENADCVSAEKNVCYQCAPPWEAITRWEQAQRALHPLPRPQGCDPGPFACAGLPVPPATVCRNHRCALAP